VTGEDNHDVTFSVAVNNPSGLPLFYEWSREGSGPIPGANGPTYTFQATLADDGAMFNVTVSKVGAAVASRTARLTMVPDTSGPKVLEVLSPGLTNIIVRYNERVELFTATDNVNYLLTGPSFFDIALGTLEPDGSTVTLTPVEGQQLTAGETYELRVESVQDLGFLTIDPNPTLVTFIAGSGAPRLAIERSGDQVVLSWPVTAAGYILEQTSDLANWTLVGITPTVAAGRNNVTVAVEPGMKAFRLRL
jgi:hypothetical protein